MTETTQLIGADAHVDPPATFRDDVLPKSMAGSGPRIEDGTTAADHDWIVVEGSRKPLNLMSSVSDQGKKVYGSFIRDPMGMRNRHLSGGRNIMWFNDDPHSESTSPDSLAAMHRLFGELDDAKRASIVRDNARRFYGLSV